MRLSPTLSLAAIAAAAAVLNGCATLDEEQCLVGDWAGIGYQDGAQGHPYARFSEHVEACARHAVTPDPTLYEQGRQQGLARYCTDVSGFSAGRRGAGYRGVCPAHLEGDFLSGFADGQTVLAAQQAYDAAYNEEAVAISRGRSLETEIRADEALLAAEETTDAERDAIRQRLRRLRGDRERALDEAENARWRMQQAERDIGDLRSRFTPYYGAW